MTVSTADPPRLVVEGFAGPGGWSTGLAMLLRFLRLTARTVGVEWDDAACKTAHAAGHTRVRADVARFDLTGLAGLVWLLIMSPPCQAWSRSGKRKGILDQPAIFAHAARVIAAGEWIPYADAGPLPQGEGDEGGTWHDARSPLVLEVIRWVLAVQPANICLEQVPDVLPFWELIARWLRSRGYNVWAGCLSSERYGVPQTRERAIVIASRERAVSAPAATHTAYDSRLSDGGKWHGTDGDLFGEGLEPWVSMAEALGWGMTARPSTTVVTGANGGGPDPMSGRSGSRAIHRREREEGRWIVNTRGDRQTPGGNEFSADRPSWALTEKTRSWTVRTGNNSMVTSRTGSKAGDGGVQPYERPIEHPAPTLDTNVGSKWRLHTNRGQEPDGTRQVIDPSARRAPTLTAKSGGQWIYRNGNQANAARRELDEPAPTVMFAERSNKVDWEAPGGVTARVTVQEAAVLQSFPPGYPWQGTKSAQFRQVGDAVPPRLAAAVIGTCLGLDWQEAVAAHYGQERAA